MAELAAGSQAEQKLLDAVERGDAAAVEAMLAAGADANARFGVEAGGCVRPLFKAAEKGRVSVIGVLLNHGADVNAADGRGSPDLRQHGCTALHYAARCGHVEAVRLLLERGADVNAATATAPDDRPRWHGGCQPLHLTAACGHAAVVGLLLARGADARAAATWRGVPGVTPLHLWARYTRTWQSPEAQVTAMSALLDAGAPVDAADGDGKRPLHWAVNRASRDAVALLLARGADVNAADDSGAAPLHLACRLGARLARQVVELLLERGADARAADARGWQPLHYLADEKSYQNDLRKGIDYKASVDACARLVTALVSRGADVDAVSSDGETPLMLAVSGCVTPNYPASEVLLHHHRARVGPPVCARCATAEEVRFGVQRVVLGMAAEAARLKQQQAAWEEERAALARQQAAWERERAALQEERTAWEQERAARG